MSSRIAARFCSFGAGRATSYGEARECCRPSGRMSSGSHVSAAEATALEELLGHVANAAIRTTTGELLYLAPTQGCEPKQRLVDDCVSVVDASLELGRLRLRAAKAEEPVAMHEGLEARTIALSPDQLELCVGQEVALDQAVEDIVTQRGRCLDVADLDQPGELVVCDRLARGSVGLDGGSSVMLGILVTAGLAVRVTLALEQGAVNDAEIEPASIVA